MEDILLHKLREDAISLFYAGIKAASPYILIPNSLLLEENILTVSDINRTSKSFDLRNYSRIIVIGAGKASTSMAYEMEKILDDTIENPRRDSAGFGLRFRAYLIDIIPIVILLNILGYLNN